MTDSSATRRKVAVVGAGAVGSTFAYALAQSGLADEIVLIDRNQDLVAGQVLDLAHGQPFFPTVRIRAGAPSDYADARLIVVTAGAAQRPGETRMDLLRRNAAVVRAVVGEIVGQESSAVVLVVTNPVDIMTQVAIHCAGWPRGRVFGSGTVLDSARLRHLLSVHCGVDVHNIHAYVLGEHGDSEVLAWSAARAGSVPVASFAAQVGAPLTGAVRQRIDDAVRRAAYTIIEGKGATWYGIGAGLARVAVAIARDEGAVFSVSIATPEIEGVTDVALSIPRVVGRAGVVADLVPDLAPAEHEALHASAAMLKALADAVPL